MARKAFGKHATQVDTNQYPDDGSSPVGSNEWNEAPDAGGMLGFDPTNATRTIASGILPVTDTVCLVMSESSTSDDLDKLSITDTSQYDLVYLFAQTGHTITLKHTSSLVSAGQIQTVSGIDETLSETSPTILMRKGNYWYGYGGGVVNNLADVQNVTITSNTSGELLKWNGTAWVNNTLSEAGISATGHNHVAAHVTDFDTEVANNSAVTLNTAKNSYPSADSTKLAGIETGATADQTAAEIKTAYESNNDTNEFSDAEQTKLAGLETSATADQTGAEIKALYEVESSAFTDAQFTKLSNIETSATADQTGAEIKTLYEAEASAFTDAQFTKLAGIETLADVTDATNVDAAGAVMESDTTIASMSFVVDEDNMSSDSETKVPTQQSVKAYVDTEIASGTTSDITLKGDYNASTNSPDLDTSPSGVKKGDHYVVSVAGTFFTEALQAGDSIISKQDNPTTLAHWILTNNNLTTPITNNEISATAAIVLSKLAVDPLARANHTGTQAFSTITGTVPETQGGTGQTTFATGDIMYASGANTLTKLTAGTDGDQLQLASGIPSWVTPSGADPTSDINYSGLYDIEDIQRVCYEIQSSGFGTDTTNNADRTGESQVYVRNIDSNNDGIFIRMKKAGSIVEVQIA